MARPAPDLRACIRGLKLIRMLEQHALEGIEMRTTQITAALALLKKVLPDLGTAEPDPPGLSHEDALRELE